MVLPRGDACRAFHSAGGRGNTAPAFAIAYTMAYRTGYDCRHRARREMARIPGKAPHAIVHPQADDLPLELSLPQGPKPGNTGAHGYGAKKGLRRRFAAAQGEGQV